MTSRKAQFRASYLGGIAIVIAALVGINVFGQLRFKRFDLTGSGTFTISPAMRRILGRLRDQVKVTYYVSKELPEELRGVRRETLDRFQDFERAVGEKFKYRIVDVPREIFDEKKREADPSLRRLFDELASEHVEPLHASVGRQGSQEESLIFSTITVAYLEKPTEYIRAYGDARHLEYELAMLLVRLTEESQPVVAFFDGKPTYTEQLTGGPGTLPQRVHEFWIPLRFLGQTFDVREITLDEGSPIPDGTDCLVVVQPSNLTERQKYEINRYISGGGDAILFVSEYAVDTESGRLPFPMEPNTPNLNDLFETWGFTIGPGLVADAKTSVEITKAVPVGDGVRMEPQWMPMFLYLTGEYLDQHSPLTTRFAGLYFRNATPIVLDEATLRENGIEAEVLAETSPDSWLLPAARLPYLSPFLFRAPPKDEMEGPQKLAVLLRGTFPFKYEGQPVPEWPSAEGEDGATGDGNVAGPDDLAAGDAGSSEGAGEAGGADDALAERTPELVPPVEARPATVLVVSTAELIKITEGDVRGTPEWTNERLRFFVSAVETLARGEGLASIRAKTLTARPFEKSSRAKMTAYTLINLLSVPIVVIAVGVGHYTVRRRSRRVYRERGPS